MFAFYRQIAENSADLKAFPEVFTKAFGKALQKPL